MRILTLFGINLRINIFFLLLFILYWQMGVIVQALVVFTAVFLHEIGHVVVALGYGVKVTDVELLPFGGVARLEGSIELHPAIDTYIAAAGPLTSGFLAVMGLVMENLEMGNQQWLPFFVQCNLFLVAFNLLPAFPLDGGRILRAFLSLRVGLKRATEGATNLSSLIGVIMACIGVWSVVFNEARNFNFLVISFFLLYFAAKEKGTAMFIFMKFLSRKKEDLFREGVLLTRQLVALESAVLKDVVKYFVPQKYHLVVVVNRDHSVKGTVTEGEIINAMLGYGPETVLGSLIPGEK